MLYDDQRITGTPFEGVDTRLIFFHGKFGTITLSVADAEAAAIALGEAVERARDSTPLDEPVTHKARSMVDRTIPKALLRRATEDQKAILKELGLI